MKISNLKQHYEAKHRHSEEAFPAIRTTKINALDSCRTASTILVTSMMQQQQATENSYRVVWIFDKHKKLFSD